MILVFGGGGQVAQELSRMAAQKNISLVSLPRSSADITDPGSVEAAVREYRPALVVNAAAYTNVDQAEDDYAKVYRSNAEGPGVVAAACAAADIPLLHISTDYVFDGTKPTPYVESDPIAPINAYGRTKAAGEAAVRRAAPKHVIFRTAWVYGEFGRNFLKTILRLACEREELRIVVDQRGCPTSTNDIARAILGIAPPLAAKEAAWGTYHYCGGGITTWFEFAERIVSLQAPVTRRSPKVVPIATQDYPTRARRPANSALDSSQFARVFGIVPNSWIDECGAAVRSLLKG